MSKDGQSFCITLCGCGSNLFDHLPSVEGDASQQSKIRSIHRIDDKLITCLMGANGAISAKEKHKIICNWDNTWLLTSGKIKHVKFLKKEKLFVDVKSELDIQDAAASETELYLLDDAQNVHLGDENRCLKFSGFKGLGISKLFVTNNTLMGLSLDDGRVYEVDCSLGSDSANICQAPRLIISNYKIKKISCGFDHQLFLTNFGVVLSRGLGSRGQLGFECYDYCSTPSVVSALDGITCIDISAGGWHSAALTDLQEVYVWGWNQSHQLGLPRTEEGVSINLTAAARKVTVGESIVQVSCGCRHTCAVTDEGEVYGWGYNKYGQLATEPCDYLELPTKLPVKDVIAATCGHWSTYFFCKEFT